MELTRDIVEAEAAEYEEEEALYAVEAEQLHGLPDAFASGNYGWRDAAWVVRWHFRRYLGDYPDDRRRDREEAFGDNDFETVRAAIEGSIAASGTAEKTDRLTALDGVDVPVASAFLQFFDPEGYVVMGDREWAALGDEGELSAPYPDEPTVEDYGAYLAACRSVVDRTGCDLVRVHRALWRLGKER